MSTFETKSYRVKFVGGIDGVQLAGIVDRPLDWGERSDEQQRPVAVFSHCFTCNKDLKATVRISRALAKAGVAVLRFDMTGLGGSEGDFSQTNFSTNLRDLASAIHFADAELGKVTALIGHSFGGVASLVTAGQAANPSQAADPPLDQLAFVGTIAAPSDTHHLATVLAKMDPEIERAGVGSVSIGGVSWTIRQQMLEDFRRHDVTALIPGIQCPVMLLHSPVDQTVSFDHALRLMGLIQAGPRSGVPRSGSVSLVALPGADHLLVSNPEDLVFVSSLLAACCHRHQ